MVFGFISIFQVLLENCFFLLAYSENCFYFTDRNVTLDVMIAYLADLWPTIKVRLNSHTTVIKADNGPENNSRRCQVMKRLTVVVIKNEVRISSACSAPHHGKYPPSERVWTVLKTTGKSASRNSVWRLPMMIRRLERRSCVKLEFPTASRLSFSAHFKTQERRKHNV